MLVFAVLVFAVLVFAVLVFRLLDVPDRDEEEDGRGRELDDEAVQDWDQLILRLTKLQDTMGSRLFAATLEVLQEPYDDRPMIDRLNRLEKLGYLASVEEWQRLRVIRNRFAHDYPEDDALKAALLNEAAESVASLAGILARFEHVAGSGRLD